MVKLNYAELQLDHLVIFEHDNTIFVAARYNGSALRIFLVYESTGNVYTRNGRADSWEHIKGDAAELIRNRIAEARTSGGIPTYRLSGSHEN